MVALALLMILAVFAAMFLTSSRFDREASSAAIDRVRLDLYAEGMAQYVQSCMVAGLWGFDDMPLNYDGVANPLSSTFAAVPGPDVPFDYYGGSYTATIDGESVTYFPNFWLTDPRLTVSATVPNPQVYLHAAFAPDPAAANYEIPFSDTTYGTLATLQRDYADLDGDNRADTPWLFVKPLGNGLYMRAAVRVEDTSSRINVNVADQPIDASSDLAAIYCGYPADVAAAISASSLGDEKAGGFLSEWNLRGLVGDVAWSRLNNGDGADIPGRYGKTGMGVLSWPHIYVPYGGPPSLVSMPGDTPVLRLLLGDPGLNSATHLSNGRFGVALDAMLGHTWATTPGTYDPDGLIRRLAAPGGLGAEQDRPFGTEETFDLMTLAGTGGMPGKTRLESLWPALSAPGVVPWRNLFTAYSWALDLCPYGEDPYANNTFRKVDLNTCTAEQLYHAIQIANSRAMYGSLVDDQMKQLAVNFIAYRNRPMTAGDLAIYLMGVHDRASTTAALPPPAWLEWDAAAWSTYITTQSFSTDKTEAAYLAALNAQRGTAAFWAEIDAALAATPRISPTRVPEMTILGTKYFGMARSPFITEVWRNIQYPVSVVLPADPGDPTKVNDYGVELYNPWPIALSLDNWYLCITGCAGGDKQVDLSGQTIAASGRLVIRRLVGGAGIIQDADLVIATQVSGSLSVELVYSPDGTPGAAPYAVFDEVPNGELAGFVGGEPPVANAGSRYRRDDSGFWCYQRWYDDPAGTLGAANVLPAADEPWTVASYGPNPAVPIVGVGRVMSPAELALIPYNVPRMSWVAGSLTFAGATSSTDLTSESTRLGEIQLPGLGLFHRAYVQPIPDKTEPMAVRPAVGVMQSLLDYVTVVDYKSDMIDNNGDGTVDDVAELRVPGRLNVNTVTDDFAKLDAATAGLPILPFTNPANARDASFWRNLIGFRDLTGSYAAGRGLAAANDLTLQAAEPGRTKPAISKPGELATMQLYDSAAGTFLFQGFWQDRDITGNGSFDRSYMLPAQHIRRFAANANLLTTRSDTFMVTVRVEIVRPVYDGVSLTRIDSFGRREYMYLVDRSFCVKPPQQAPVAAGDPFFNARVNLDFIPPRVWRMAVPGQGAY